MNQELSSYDSREQNISAKIKSLLKKTILFLIFAAIFFLLLKTFYLDKPKLSPLETATAYLKLAQNPKSEESEKAKKYLFSDLGKIEILGEKYKEVRWVQKEKEGEEPIFEETPSQSSPNLGGEKKGIKITLLEKTNKNQGLIFFGYKLPKEILFEVYLAKEGDRKSGYFWKIIKINSPTLIFEGKIGERQLVRENMVFARVIKLEEYASQNRDLPKELKILTLEIEYQNDGPGPAEFLPFSEWKVADKNGQEYGPPPLTSARVLREPALLGRELKAGEKKIGYVSFEVPKDFIADKIILKNLERKVIYKATDN